MTRRNRLRIGVYNTLGVIALVFLAHPYTRQTVFGPRVAGMPFAYWQDRCRATALRAEQEPSFMAKVLRVMRLNRGAGAASDAEMLPVFLSLRDDPSEHVRAHVVDLLGRYRDSPQARAAAKENRRVVYVERPAAVRWEYAHLTAGGRSM